MEKEEESGEEIVMEKRGFKEEGRREEMKVWKGGGAGRILEKKVVKEGCVNKRRCGKKGEEERVVEEKAVKE